MGALSKESFVYANSVTPGNVINSNACITPSNLINSLNSGGRSSSANSIKRKLDDTDNKSEVKKVSPKVRIMKVTPVLKNYYNAMRIFKFECSSIYFHRQNWKLRHWKLNVQALPTKDIMKRHTIMSLKTVRWTYFHKLCTIDCIKKCTKYVKCPLITCSITFLDLRKVYPYYFTFTTFTKGRWVGERILDVFAREFRAHPATEYVSI